MIKKLLIGLTNFYRIHNKIDNIINKFMNNNRYVIPQKSSPLALLQSMIETALHWFRICSI